VRHRQSGDNRHKCPMLTWGWISDTGAAALRLYARFDGEKLSDPFSGDRISA
jgi:hypothetical protein